MRLRETYTYNDVLLVPKYSNIRSRHEVDISSNLSDTLHFRMPVISAPMDTVTQYEMAKEMDAHGGFGVIHRYNTIEDQARIVALLPSSVTKAAAVGVSGDYAERAAALVEMGADILCLDVAHGHHVMMKEALHYLRSEYPDIHLMAGNVATYEGFHALAEWGANSVRCNIGGGSICSTRVQTGHGMPGLQTIFDCAHSPLAGEVKIIADGGIRNSGDIVKALAAGADFVMLGSLLAGTTETPGTIKSTPDNKLYKEYRGMASKAAQNDWRKRTSSIEGIAATVPFKGPVSGVLKDLTVGIRSGLSYSGARNIKQLRENAEFICQTSAGQIESSTHILRN